MSPEVGTNEIELIDFESRDDHILGAGICDGFPLLFTNKDGLLSIIPNKQDIRYGILYSLKSASNDINVVNDM